MKILNILNLNVGSIQSLLEFCNQRIESNKGAFLVPMNPIKVIKARKYPDFQEIINFADWVFPDASGIRWAANFLYKKKISLIPGYKLMFRLFDQAEKNNRSVYLLGTQTRILEMAVNKLKKLHPDLNVAGSQHGYFPASQEKSIFRNIGNLKPDYVFCAMGEYKQETVIRKLKEVHPGAIYLGVGGSFDLMAGIQPTPPAWIRNYQLEWLFRMLKQPFRLPRFKALPIFVWLVLFEKIKLIIK